MATMYVFDFEGNSQHCSCLWVLKRLIVLRCFNTKPCPYRVFCIFGQNAACESRMSFTKNLFFVLLGTRFERWVPGIRGVCLVVIGLVSGLGNRKVGYGGRVVYVMSVVCVCQEDQESWVGGNADIGVSIAGFLCIVNFPDGDYHESVPSGNFGRLS